jgi:hypothetical protein
MNSIRMDAPFFRHASLYCWRRTGGILEIVMSGYAPSQSTISSPFSDVRTDLGPHFVMNPFLIVVADIFACFFCGPLVLLFFII